MRLTRQELIEKIKNNDYQFFENAYWDSLEVDNDYKIVWELNWGDGNEIFIAIEFPEEKIIALLEGTYSSHDTTYWNEVTFGSPYEFKETRYKSVTLADIRDMKIDEVLND
jgi:hypothetical protein